MSRSHRKPYWGNPDSSHWWKRHFNNIIRRSKDEVADGAYYKRVNETWNSPMENAGAYCDVPKMRRK